MSYRIARWLLTRLLVALMLALTLTVAARQFIETGSSDLSVTLVPEEGGPIIGQHWHATYKVVVCGQRQPNLPFWEGGVHTHDDGLIHIHPISPDEQGAGARLTRWFEYGGGKLTQDGLRLPTDNREFRNGDLCPDGSQGKVQVYVNGQPLTDWSEYIPQDGHRVVILFGPEPLE